LPRRSSQRRVPKSACLRVDAGERRGKGAGEGGGRPAVEDAGEEI
jgi:hypothetical protein